MPELPKGWGLTTKKNAKGTLDVMGKDDSGKDYRVRITDSPEITDKDVQELKAADRESYPNREAGVREFVKSICPPEQKTASTLAEAMTFDESSWIAAAEPVIHAGFGRAGCTVGSTWSYRRGWERMMKEEN